MRRFLTWFTKIAPLILVAGCGDDVVPSFDGQWVIGSYHIVEDLPGEEPSVLIRQLTFSEDAGVTLWYASCAGETESQATWTAVAQAEVEVSAAGGDEYVSFGADYLRLRATPVEGGIRVQFTGEAEVDLGTDEFEAGRVCLNCANVGPDQAYSCPEGP